MSSYITPGRSKVYWVLTVTTTSTPTDLELQAGTDLTPKLRGLPNIPRSANTADSSDLSSTFEKRQRGTVGGDVISFELKRDTGTETEYDAMDEGDEGYLAVFRKGFATTQPTIGDKVDIFTCTVNVKGDGNPGRNDVDFSMFELVVTDNPDRDVSVITT